MRWDVFLKAQMRWAVINRSSRGEVAPLANLFGRQVGTACLDDESNLEDGVDELDSSLEILNDDPLYHDVGVELRTVAALLLTRAGRVTEARESLLRPIEILDKKVNDSVGEEQSALAADCSLLSCAYAVIRRHENDASPLHLQEKVIKNVIRLKDSWNRALLSSSVTYQRFILTEYRAALIRVGEVDVAEVAGDLIEGFTEKLPPPWILEPALWKLN